MLRTRRALWVLALLAFLAYAPLLTIPLIEDDYPNLWQSLNYGSLAGFPELLHDSVFRLRATSFWAMYVLWHAARLTPLIYHLVSLLLHIANTWLVYAVCTAWPRMRSAALWAAAFFAVAEGHQEAVVWFSAINELFQFLFGMGALWCWLRGRNWGVALFALALISKESAVVFLALLLLAGWDGDRRRLGVRLIPYALLAAAAVASVAASRSVSFRFTDGSFSLHAPFWIVWPKNYLRVLSVWGLLAVAVIFAARDHSLVRRATPALAWIGIALVPYCFLTYSTAIPSRQLYLASAGVAMLFGLAVARWQARRGLVAAVVAIMVVHNVGYLWTKKRNQFLERAAPTEQLIAMARHTPGPIWVRCFPRNRYIAEEAVHMGAGQPPSDLIWDDAEAARRHITAQFCYQEK